MAENLSEFFIEKAKEELREDEGRKQQSFKILNDWISKHPFIRVINEDCLNLNDFLPFLRTRKYQMDKVYDSIEKTFIAVKYFSKLTDFSADRMTRLLKIYDTGCYIVSKDRDSEGRRIVFRIHKNFDFTVSSEDILALDTLGIFVLTLEEETQIAGTVFINYGENITLNYLSLFPLKDVYDFANQAKIFPMRIKKILMVSFPTIASQILSLVRSAFSEKTKKRFYILNDNTELTQHIDISLLPKEYGGAYSIHELQEDFRPKLIKGAEYLNKFLANFEVDLKKIDKFKEFNEMEMTGTFRKLEID